MLKQPVSVITVIHHQPSYLQGIEKLQEYVKQELNCLELLLKVEDPSLVKLEAKPNSKVLGQRLQKSFDKTIRRCILELPHEQILNYEE